VENGEMALIFTVVSVTPRWPRIDECCGLLTLSKIPRTIGVSIRIEAIETQTHSSRNLVS
jgi:hypothetical protein